jgi:hypothetical protein
MMLVSVNDVACNGRRCMKLWLVVQEVAGLAAHAL